LNLQSITRILKRIFAYIDKDEESVTRELLEEEEEEEEEEIVEEEEDVVIEVC